MKKKIVFSQNPIFHDQKVLLQNFVFFGKNLFGRENRRGRGVIFYYEKSENLHLWIFSDMCRSWTLTLYAVIYDPYSWHISWVVINMRLTLGKILFFFTAESDILGTKNDNKNSKW